MSVSAATCVMFVIALCVSRCHLAASEATSDCQQSAVAFNTDTGRPPYVLNLLLLLLSLLLLQPAAAALRSHQAV
jgi:hypothetical protein